MKELGAIFLMFCVLLSIYYYDPGMFPDCLKLARVTSIPKGGDSTTQSEIYRRGNVENGWKLLIMVDHARKRQ